MGKAATAKRVRHGGPRRVVAIGLVVILIAGVYVLFLIPARTQESPLLLQRGDDGQLHPVSPESTANDGLHLAAHTGKLDSRNNTSKGVSTTHSSPAFFSARSIAVLNNSDHLLLKRVGEALVERLQTDGHIDRLDYYPAGHVPDLGGAAPDFFITLALDSVRHSGILGHTLDAKVSAAIGTTLVRGNSSTTDHLTPPTVKISGNILVEHHSTFTGVESSASKYILQGQDIAKQLAKSIKATLDDVREDHDSSPKLPEAFYPSWREAPEFGFLVRFDADRITGLHRLMNRNESFWRLRPVEDPIEAIVAIRDELREQGWRGGGDEPPKMHYVRMTKDAQVLEVFEPSHRMHTSSRVTITTADNREAEPVPLVQLYVKYDDRMNREELAQILEDMLNNQPDAELLLTLHRFAERDLRQRIIEAAEASPRPSVAGLLALANIYANRKSNADVTRVLNRLHHLKYVIMDTSDVTAQTKQHIKKLKLDKTAVEKFDRAVFAKLGFVAISDETLPQEITTSIGEPARFVFGNDEEEFGVVAIDVDWVNRSRTPPTFSVRVTEGGPSHGRSSSFSSGVSLPNRHHVDWFGRRLLLVISQTEGNQIRIVASDPAKSQ